ncbi:MAG: Rrf2 family transcriptional regulator [Planctomycetes bacterium]|nr:Rrf2 family transcriptional regulator [Planctomycetota bacterium]
MVRISEAFGLAFHTVQYLVSAEPGTSVSGVRLGKIFGVSAAHLAKVLPRLVRAGILASRRGPTGGFVLACDPDAVTLLDVYRAVEGDLSAVTCMLGRPRCPEGTCVMERLHQTVHDEVYDRLSSTRLSDLAVRTQA